MARNADVSIPARTWTQLTNGNVTELRLQVQGRFGIRIKATAGEVPPTNTGGSIEIRPGDGIAGDQTLAQLFPGVAGANRVYAYANGPTSVSVSHA